MTTHELKTWPEPFAAMVDGRKAFEIRRDDRNFAVGDALLLREYEPPEWRCGLCGAATNGQPDGGPGGAEWKPDPFDGGWVHYCHAGMATKGRVADMTRAGRYTGEYLTGRVTFKVPGGAWGLPADLCVLAVALDAPLYTSISVAPAATVGEEVICKCGRTTMPADKYIRHLGNEVHYRPEAKAVCFWHVPGCSEPIDAAEPDEREDGR